MKIDLHCHTKATKQGDGEGRNVNLELFKEKIADAEVKIVAITNHNVFDYQQFIEFKEAVIEYCQLWPGIEIDIRGKESKYHLIVVANPDNALSFSERIEGLYKDEDIGTCQLNLEAVIDSLNACDVIYIPHLHKKNGISDEDHKMLVDLVGDESRVFAETTARSLGVYANHDYNVITGSDVKNWKKYETSTFAELKLPVDSFTQFCLLSKKDTTVVETLLNKKNSYELLASPHKSSKIKLKIFQDINIIFGQKGTGKTEILNSLYNSLIEKGIKCTKYSGSEKEEDFKALLSINDILLDVERLGVSDCKDEFKYILDWHESSLTKISKYIEWYKTRDNSDNKSRMKITNSTTMIENESDGLQRSGTDYKKQKKVLTTIREIPINEYLNNNDVSLLENLVDKLGQNITGRYKKELLDYFATKLANHTINTIKQIADRNSNTVSKPSTTGFQEFATNRLKLKHNVETVLDAITDKTHYDYSPLGEIEGKGKVLIRKTTRMLCSDSRTEEFRLGIICLKKAKNLLFDVRNNVFSDNISSVIDIFRTHCEENRISSAQDFLGRSKQIVTEDKMEYNPSNGEKGILMLQKKLNESADAFFLDEPELGMGNSYIDTTIRPKLMELGKAKKCVVVATHNANIAVRSLPYMSIFRTHENGVYQTYVGNPFNDRLINIDNPMDVKSWVDESLHTLEGGKEAFYERKNIYESNGN